MLKLINDRFANKFTVVKSYSSPTVDEYQLIDSNNKKIAFFNQYFENLITSEKLEYVFVEMLLYRDDDDAFSESSWPVATIYDEDSLNCFFDECEEMLSQLESV